MRKLDRVFAMSAALFLTVFCISDIFSSHHLMASTDSMTWTTRSSGTSNTLSRITYGNSTFIAVGEEGTIVTSPDGVTWTTRDSGTTKSLTGITYGNSTFVAVGSDGTIVTSPDGVTWTTRDSGTTKYLSRITYGNSTFVAVGGGYNSGIVVTSSDGVTWTARNWRTGYPPGGITYGNSTFVAVAYRDAFTSSDGITWSKSGSLPIDSTISIYDITYGNSIFVAVANLGKIFTSTDCVTWTTRRSSGMDGYWGIRGVAYGNSTFVAVAGGGFYYTSPDGITWTTKNSSSIYSLNKVAYGNSTFVAVGWDGRIVQSSSDATTPTPSPSPTPSPTPDASPTPTTCTDSYEPNDSSSTAYGPLSSGASYSGKICSDSDVDWFKVNITTAGTISINLTVPSSNDYYVELYGPSYTWVAGYDNGGTGASESISYSATTTGNYYIRVLGYNGSYNTTNAYTLTYTFTASATSTPTPSPSPTPTPEATPTSTTITPKIAAGDSHTLALKSDGTVWAWGGNDYGQLGDGTTTDKSTPVQVSGLSSVTAISAGKRYYSLALKSDGTVWAWGDNSIGQLGDGTTTKRITPVQVSSLSGVTAIVAGLYHSLALKSDGTVWAWGWNNYGQLGDGGTNWSSSTPIQVSGISGVIAISGRRDHSLALKSDGTVWVWGWNEDGQLGDGTTTNRSTPVQVSSISSIAAIAGGDSHSLALKSDGTVWAWGNNSNGILGDGTTTNRNTPVQVSGLSGVTAITSGGGNNLALKSDGTVCAWGLNGGGQLGDGTTTNRSTPVQVNDLNRVTAIACGGHSLALKADGTLWAWGYNDYGQLGDGTTTNRTTPIQIDINLGQTITSTPTPQVTPSPSPTPTVTASATPTTTPGGTPHIDNLSPVFGAPGTNVTIAGSNFGAEQGSSKVNFSTVSADITSWSDTEIQATVSSLSAGTYDVTVSTDGGTSNSISFLLTESQSGGDFSVKVTPAQQTIVQGSSITYSVLVKSANGFNQSVTLAAEGLPSGASAEFSPNPISPGESSVLTISTTTNTSIGMYSFKVKGSGNGLTRKAKAKLQVKRASGAVLSFQRSYSSEKPLLLTFQYKNQTEDKIEAKVTLCNLTGTWIKASLNFEEGDHPVSVKDEQVPYVILLGPYVSKSLGTITFSEGEYLQYDGKRTGIEAIFALTIDLFLRGTLGYEVPPDFFFNIYSGVEYAATLAGDIIQEIADEKLGCSGSAGKMGVDLVSGNITDSLTDLADFLGCMGTIKKDMQKLFVKILKDKKLAKKGANYLDDKVSLLQLLEFPEHAQQFANLMCPSLGQGDSISGFIESLGLCTTVGSPLEGHVRLDAKK
ncbi:MAG: IPT/TIG domain-containing protein [Planctomycetes bacterium]|nr:IPT/TIG domain-containing protein [Planctomycetota bacterium]